MNYTIEKANEFVLENQNKVNNKYRLKYHMMPPCGWMNDPNGLVKFNNQYHLFYQFYPYEAKWGPMHWGHFISNDLIKYQNASVALAPENQNVESGCFSGGAIVADDKLHLVYTRHFETEDYKSETQFIARTDDGSHFQKDAEALFDNNELPKGVSRADLRDPNPVYIGGKYHIFVGGKLETTNQGVLIVLTSDDMHKFKYDFMIGPIDEFGEMCECPSYFTDGNRDYFLASGVNVKPKGNDYLNETNVSFVLGGKLDFVNKKMAIDYIQEIDKGDTFYSPQIITNNHENIMVGWMEMWAKRYPTYEWNHGWVGSFSIPRVITFNNGKLYQWPVDTLKNYYQKTYCYKQNDIIPQVSDIYVKAQGEFKLEFKASNGSFVIGQDQNSVYLDARNTNNLNDTFRRTNYYYDNVELRLLFDVSSVEIFVNNGIEVITSRIYLDSEYKLDLEGNIHSIIINEIGV